MAIEALMGYEPEVLKEKRTQVFQATHDGMGELLSHADRSFISFSYGGKNIEDFNLLAITENNSRNGGLYTEFTDNVSESEVLDGQLYWNTHYKPNKLTIYLFTDGITEKQLNEFAAWLIPGKEKELILSEHPNRGIMARVESVPNYSLLPFEEKVKRKYGGREVELSTTLYKGRINITFVMDDPFWYSIATLFENKNNNWIGKNSRHDINFNDRDLFKVLEEDNILIEDMLSQIKINTIPADGDTPAQQKDFLLGNEPRTEYDLTMRGVGSKVGFDDGKNFLSQTEEYYKNSLFGARIDYGHVGYYLLNTESGITLNGIGIDAENNITNSQEEITGQQKIGYIYYGGTAPMRPIINFTLTPTINAQTHYIDFPANSFDHANATTYNKIIFQSMNKKEFRFTTPGIYTGYNQVIKILKETSAGSAWEDVRKIIRSSVRHYAPRDYAIGLIDKQTEALTTEESLNSTILNMALFLGSENNLYPAVFSINCQNGESVAFIQYNSKKNKLETIPEENVGDMVLVNYLSLTDRNQLQEDTDGSLIVKEWSSTHPEASYRIYTDAKCLNNLTIQYNFLYL